VYFSFLVTVFNCVLICILVIIVVWLVVPGWWVYFFSFCWKECIPCRGVSLGLMESQFFVEAKSF
jgi:hypothetical protein